MDQKIEPKKELTTKKIETIKETNERIIIKLELVRLIFLKISNSSLSKSLINRNWVDIKKINGKEKNVIDNKLKE